MDLIFHMIYMFEKMRIVWIQLSCRDYCKYNITLYFQDFMNAMMWRTRAFSPFAVKANKYRRCSRLLHADIPIDKWKQYWRGWGINLLHINRYLLWCHLYRHCGDWFTFPKRFCCSYDCRCCRFLRGMNMCAKMAQPVARNCMYRL